VTAARRTDVAVIGAGPVGLLLALILGRHGRRVDVLERQARPYGRPRAVHLDHESARILQSAGVMTDLEARTEPMDAYEWRNADGATLLRIGVEGAPGVSGWPPSLMFSQPELEAILETAVAALDHVVVRRAWRVTGLDDRPDAVAVRAVGLGDDPVVVEADWVIGCDGAGSTVRDVTGLALTDTGASFRWFVVDIVPTRPRPWHPLNIQLCDPMRPTTAVSGGPGRRRFEFMHLPGEPPELFEDARTAWRLLEPWGFSPANATLERSASYTYRARSVERWRRGRVLLAGDAAHQMPPFAGQGLCSGLRDVANLAWKLDLVLAGLAPDGLLDTYGSERSPQIRAEIDFSVDLGTIICILDPAEAAARDAGMIPAASASGPIETPPLPPLGPGATRPGDPHAGELALQAVVSQGGQVGRFDDVAGPGWWLLGRDRDPAADLPPALAAWWAGIGGRNGHVGPGAPIDDVDGAYRRWFDELDAAVVLQRPDFHLFGTGPADEAPALVDDLRAILSGGLGDVAPA
jgi:2-polyprenyl-6-methoxyphenol hydroxylase-like FAD-dependent oxidoreductase